MIAQMFCDFILLDTSLLKLKPSLLGAVAIYATNMITQQSKNHWSSALQQASGNYSETQLKSLASKLFYFVKRLENTTLKTIFRKY